MMSTFGDVMYSVRSLRVGVKRMTFGDLWAFVDCLRKRCGAWKTVIMRGRRSD